MDRFRSVVLLPLRAFSKLDRCLTSNSSRKFRIRHTAAAHSKILKVAVLGAAGRTGSCLSLLLKQSPLIDELAVYDTSSTHGLALELSHVDTRCRITGNSCLRETLQDAKVVMITAGKSPEKKSKMDDILKDNANILTDLVSNIMRFSPRALVGVVTEPINSMIPLISEMYKKAGVYDQSRLFGVSSLDCVRANTFVAEILGLEPECVMVPVIGGCCPDTCVPVFSHAKPCNDLTNEEIGKLNYAVKKASEEVLKEYDGKGVPSLAVAFAAARFCISLCKALRGQPSVVECAFVRSCALPDVTYFSAPLELGPNGIQRHLGLPSLSEQECKMLAAAIPTLKIAIKKGEALALGPSVLSTEMCPVIPEKCPPSPTLTVGEHPNPHAPISTA